MTTLSVILVLISCLGGVAAFISLVASLLRKNLKGRKRSLYALLGMLLAFVMGIGIFAVSGDTTAPELTVSNASLEYGQSISASALATATDDKDEDVILTITTVSPETAIISDDTSMVKFDIPGDYTVTLCAADQSGNESFADTIVHVEDNIAPEFIEFPDQSEFSYGEVIKISAQGNVANEIYVVAEDEITDVVLSFTDVQPITDGLTNVSYMLDSDSVCFTDIGDYIITITAEDGYGNVVSDTVQVAVIDTVAPEFSGIKSEYTLLDSESAPDYLDGVTAVDEIDGDVTEQIILDDQDVSYGIPGEYTVAYTVSDNSGNAVEKSSTVTIKDVTPPTLALSQSSFTVTAGDNAPDYSGVISATDAVDGDLTDEIVVDDSAVDYSTPGSYEITYTVSDGSGNAISETATVIVKSKSTTTTQSSGVSSSDGETVYITRTGEKYHRGSCRYLSQSKIAISKSDAIAQGYEACKVCKP